MHELVVHYTSFLKLGSHEGFVKPSSFKNLNADGWTVVVLKALWNRTGRAATADGLKKADRVDVSAADLLNIMSIVFIGLISIGTHLLVSSSECRSFVQGLRSQEDNRMIKAQDMITYLQH